MSWDEHPEAAEVLETRRVPGDDMDGAAAGRGLPEAARRAFVTLLTNRYVARSRQHQVWDALLTYEAEIRERLSDMFLDLVVDRETEVAFKRQREGDDFPRVLRRDKPLSRDASLVLIYISGRWRRGCSPVRAPRRRRDQCPRQTAGPADTGSRGRLPVHRVPRGGPARRDR
jgi:hypothetical protein